MHDKPNNPSSFEHYTFSNPKAPKGGKLRLISIGSFDCMNRTFKCTPPDGFGLLGDTLLDRSPNEPFSTYGNLAEKVDMADDRSWIEFTINPKAKWKDGNPVTPEDVIATYETTVKKGLPVQRLYYKQVEKAEKTGKRKVKFTFKKTEDGYNREIPLIMGLAIIYPKNFLEQNKNTFDDPSQTPPPLSGPYKVKSYEPGRFVVYERDPNYWGKDIPVNKGRYNFDEIRYDYYRDSNSALQAFKGGNHDVYREASPQKWNNSHQGPLYKDGRIRKTTLTNDKPVGLRGFSFNTRLPLFSSKLVRQALILIFDNHFVAQKVMPGFKVNFSYFDNTDLMASEVPSTEEVDLIKSIDPSINLEELAKSPLKTKSKDRRANLRKALELLKEAGWVLKNGIMINVQTGKPFSFDIVVSTNEEQKLALAFVRNLKDIGIKATVTLVDAAQYEHRKQNRNYDMIASWYATSISPGNELRHYWSCAAKDNPSSRNYPGICSKITDTLINRIPSTKTRHDLQLHTGALDRLLQEEAYIVPLFYNPNIMLATSNTIETSPSVTDALKDTQFWWAKP